MRPRSAFSICSLNMPMTSVRLVSGTRKKVISGISSSERELLCGKEIEVPASLNGMGVRQKALNQSVMECTCLLALDEFSARPRSN